MAGIRHTTRCVEEELTPSAKSSSRGPLSGDSLDDFMMPPSAATGSKSPTTILSQHRAWNRARKQADQSRAREQADPLARGPLADVGEAMIYLCLLGNPSAKGVPNPS